MSTETITVSTGTLLTMSTGKFLVESFADFHHAADVVMGQPLMTHQFASEAVADQMAREVTRQHPWLADVDMSSFPALDGTREDAERACRAWVARISAEYGETHRLTSPPETRRVPFTEGLPAKFGGTDDAGQVAS